VRVQLKHPSMERDALVLRRVYEEVGGHERELAELSKFVNQERRLRKLTRLSASHGGGDEGESRPSCYNCVL
jgi:hypothetical protein